MMKKIIVGAALTVVSSLLVAFGYLVFKSPGTTDPITGENGKLLRNSIASLEQVTLGGERQWILIRGHDRNNPVLLRLHGGPGTSEIIMQSTYNREMEKHFTVVNWDQRGAGKSFSDAVDPATLNIHQYITDAKELTEILRKRFNQDRIFLEGHSWGSALGALLVQKYPYYFKAYIGVGQVSDMATNDRQQYKLILEKAKKGNNKAAITELEAIGGPPYKNAVDKMKEMKWVFDLGTIYRPNSMGFLLGAVVNTKEYTLIEKIYKNRKGMEVTQKALLPWLQTLNLYEKTITWEIPVYFLQGRHDLAVPSELVVLYFKAIQAPKKELIWFESSAHMPVYEEPKKYYTIMVDTVLKENK